MFRLHHLSSPHTAAPTGFTLSETFLVSSLCWAQALTPGMLGVLGLQRLVQPPPLPVVQEREDRLAIGLILRPRALGLVEQPSCSHRTASGSRRSSSMSMSPCSRYARPTANSIAYPRPSTTAPPARASPPRPRQAARPPRATTASRSLSSGNHPRSPLAPPRGRPRERCWPRAYDFRERTTLAKRHRVGAKGGRHGGSNSAEG